MAMIRSTACSMVHVSMKLLKISQQRGLLLKTCPELLKAVKIMENKMILRTVTQTPQRRRDAESPGNFKGILGQ